MCSKKDSRNALISRIANSHSWISLEEQIKQSEAEGNDVGVRVQGVWIACVSKSYCLSRVCRRENVVLSHPGHHVVLQCTDIIRWSSCRTSMY